MYNLASQNEMRDERMSFSAYIYFFSFLMFFEEKLEKN